MLCGLFEGYSDDVARDLFHPPCSLFNQFFISAKTDGHQTFSLIVGSLEISAMMFGFLLGAESYCALIEAELLKYLTSSQIQKAFC